jgi:hypothetical protein
MFGVKAVGTVVGIASTGDWVVTVIAGEVFFDFDEVFSHKVDKLRFGGRISQVENLLKALRQ